MITRRKGLLENETIRFSLQLRIKTATERDKKRGKTRRMDEEEGTVTGISENAALSTRRRKKGKKEERKGDGKDRA